MDLHPTQQERGPLTCLAGAKKGVLWKLKAVQLR